MSQAKVVAHATAADLDLNDVDTLRLVHQAQEADIADHSLTIKQALKKYKKAVFWAMFLSTALIMEGELRLRRHCSAHVTQLDSS
jgi:hypothetical protein